MALGVEKIDKVKMSDLPRDHRTRWITKRKALLVRAVREGVIPLDDACKRYRLTPEEFHSWERNMDKQGLAGLRATRLRAVTRRKTQKGRSSES